jgi:tRNA threonylcarbamoyladenosine biosynthesis protein TsaB
MRVLAIDTALAACAAAVLDTDHGVVASETLPMVRGHAESLIPLTAPLADKDSQNTLTPADLAAPLAGSGAAEGCTTCGVTSQAWRDRPSLTAPR